MKYRFRAAIPVIQASNDISTYFYYLAIPMQIRVCLTRSEITRLVYGVVECAADHLSRWPGLKRKQILQTHQPGTSCGQHIPPRQTRHRGTGRPRVIASLTNLIPRRRRWRHLVERLSCRLNKDTSISCRYFLHF